jgi:MoaA/NifB/PqqE/SkfB family radical SAM enzyme
MSNKQRSVFYFEDIRTARWDIFTKCNLNCIHCSAEGLFDHTDYLPLKSALSVLDTLWGNGITHLVILGKEPFLHPDIFPIIQYAAQKGFQTDITTNGTTVNEIDIPRLISSGIRSIFFSLDGSCSKVNDVIRGQEVFQKTTKTLAELLREKKKENATIMINVNTVLNKVNASDIGNIVELCANLGVDLYRLSHMIDIGSASRNISDLYLSPADEFQVAEDILKHSSKYPKMSFDILSDKPLFLEFIYHKYNVTLPVRISGCKACSKEIYIDPLGWISPCLGTSMDLDRLLVDHNKRLQMSIFQLKDFPIKKMSIFQEFRQEYPLDKDTYKDFVPCNSCPYLTTICYPCPLDYKKKKNTEDLCLIAQKKLAR